MPRKLSILNTPRVCKGCSKEFFSKHTNTKYCSIPCFKQTRKPPLICGHPDVRYAGRGLCIECYDIARKEHKRNYNKGYREKNKKKLSKRVRRFMLKQRYEITPKQWQAIFDLQKGVCPICLGKLHKHGNKEGRRTAAVDHDHKTGRVRGLLCWRCNRVRLGNNTLELVKRMLAYLETDIDGR